MLRVTLAAEVGSAGLGAIGNGSNPKPKEIIMAAKGRISFGECPQRDSNPRYHLERVAT